MRDYIDAHTHIHMTAAESRGFLERLHYPVRFQGTVEESLPIMDRAGIRTTMIVPWIPARQLLDEMLAASAGKRDRKTPLQELGARWSTYNRWAAQTSLGRFALTRWWSGFELTVRYHLAGTQIAKTHRQFESLPLQQRVTVNRRCVVPFSNSLNGGLADDFL